MRWRLTLTYVALLAVLLAGFGAYQYVSLRQSLIAARVSSLQDDMTTARALLAKARRHRRCAAARSAPPPPAST